MKRLVAIFLILAMVFCFAACSASDADDTSSPAKDSNQSSDNSDAKDNDSDKSASGLTKIDPQTVKIASIAGDESPLNDAINKFCDLVYEKTDGMIKVENFAGGILGSEPELKEAVSLGTIQFVSMGWSLLTNKLPSSIAYLGYYQFLNRDELNEWYKGDIAQYFFDVYEKATGVRVINTGFTQSARDIISMKPFYSLDDMKGVKARTPSGVELDLKVWSAWGTVPTGMALSEVYSAMEQKVIECIELPVSYMYSYSFAETGCKYLMMSEHQLYSNLTGVNVEWFDSLPADIQDVILECLDEAAVYCTDVELSMEQTYIDNMVAEQGVEVIEVSDDFKKELQSLIQDLYDAEKETAIEEADALLASVS